MADDVTNPVDDQTNTDTSAGSDSSLLTSDTEGDNTPEDKGEEGKAAEGDKSGEDNSDDKGSEGAPENYEDFNLPDGMTFDENMLGKFKETAKSLNLSQEGAQAILDMASEHVANLATQQAERWSKTRQEWVDALKNDKDFGGDKMTETVERAKRTLKSFASPELLKFLGESGVGDNKDLIIALAKIDQALGEDQAVDGKPSGSKKSAAEVLYGSN